MAYVKGLVSVVIPTYRRSEKLCRAVESVLNQTYEQIECIVVNDNTPNDEFSLETYKKIAKYRDNPKFKFIEQDVHVNGARARNVGIKEAKGEYVAFLDDDDFWTLDKIEKQVAFLEKCDSSVGGVSTLVKFVDENEQVVRLSQPYKDGKIYKNVLRRQVDVTTCSIMLKHECLDDAGYFDENLKRHQEIQLLSFFTYKYAIALLQDYLTVVDVSGGENNPNFERIVKVKEDFFKAVDPILCNLSRVERRRIKSLHYLEVAMVALKEKKFLKAFKYGVWTISGVRIFFMAVQRILQRLQEKNASKKYLKQERKTK